MFAEQSYFHFFYEALKQLIAKTNLPKTARKGRLVSFIRKKTLLQ